MIKDVSPISTIGDEIVAEFDFLEDWSDRYTYIMDMGKALPPFPSERRTDEALVRGCQSRVWLHSERDGDRIVFTGDSDAMITRGLLAMLVRVLSGQQAVAIENADLDFLSRLGLLQNLSPTRANGLQAMISRMKQEAKILRENKK
jgi:cysteine desulfuration protein SufE